jgi:peptidylprolyl isomerase
VKKTRLLIVLPLTVFSVLTLTACAGQKKIPVAKDTVVTVNYTGTLADGSVFDTSIADGKEPLTFVAGEGNMIPGFESALMGMFAGDSKTFTIPAAQAYGPYDKDKVVDVPRSQFPADMDIKEGMAVGRQTDAGTLRGTITKISKDTVTVDFNSPLAGKDLTFNVQVLDVRKATADEISGKAQPAPPAPKK